MRGGRRGHIEPIKVYTKKKGCKRGFRVFCPHHLEVALTSEEVSAESVPALGRLGP